MRLSHVSALILLAMLTFSCQKDEPDMYVNDDGVLVVNLAELYGAQKGDTVAVHINELFRIAEERKLIEPRVKDPQAKDLCGGSGYCQGTCPNGITMMLWGWNENQCSCTFSNGTLRVQCISGFCPTLEIHCSGIQ